MERGTLQKRRWTRERAAEAVEVGEPGGEVVRCRP